MKSNETRSWPTNYRGPIAIHATKTEPANSIFDLGDEGMDAFLYRMGAPVAPISVADVLAFFQNLPRGAVLGTAVLTDCVRVESIRGRLSARELAFGNYDDGRFAWILSNAVEFATPIAARGMQGLWEWAPPDGFGQDEPTAMDAQPLLLE